MKQLVLIRHGQSQWNKENRFTGWVDVPLSEEGLKEAHDAAAMIRAEKLTFDVAYTSVLKRAIKTLWTLMEDLDQMWIPVHRSWRLNERMYGSLQGLNKTDMAKQYGEEQVHIWRRSYDVPPPALEENSPHWPGKDPRYAALKPNEIPRTECLKDTVARFVPYWESDIAPAIRGGKRVLIAAHGNSIRALIKHLENTPNDELVNLNIPTAIPLLYELTDDLKPIRRRYLGDEEAAKAKAAAVAAQGKA